MSAVVEDAAALVRCVAWPDLPHGFVAVPADLPRNVYGLSCGTGVRLGQAYGVRGGQSAVLVNAAAIAARGRVVADWVLLHEAAHACTAPADADPATIARLVGGTNTRTADATAAAELHPPAWGMVLAVYGQRAIALRRGNAPALLKQLSWDVARYGYTWPALAQLASGLPPDAPLREHALYGGVFSAMAESCLPGIDERVAAVVRSGLYPARLPAKTVAEGVRCG
jgi:hypothetical protein